MPRRTARHLPRGLPEPAVAARRQGLPFNGQHRVSFIAELHNVLNSSAGQNSFGTATQSFASQAAFDAARLTTSYFGRVQEIVAPRVLKVGVKLEF